MGLSVKGMIGMEPEVYESILAKIKRLQAETEKNMAIMDKSNSSNIFKFMWDSMLTNHFKKAKKAALRSWQDAEDLLTILNQ